MSKGILTAREREVFELLILNVMQKMNVKGRSGAIIELLKLGEINL